MLCDERARATLGTDRVVGWDRLNVEDVYGLPTSLALLY
jgi:hypothetical protein